MTLTPFFQESLRLRMETTQLDIYRALAVGRLPAGVSRRALPRLRFDRTAQKCVQDLQAFLVSDVPEGAAVIVVISAPIRLPTRTVAAVGVRTRDILSENGIGPTFDETICGNRVRMRVVLGVAREAPKVIVFVCNPVPLPEDLMDLTEALLA